MLNFPIQNIANIGRTVYLFNRQRDGRLTIQQDNAFFPYFFNESSTGVFRTIDGKKVNRVNCREPGEIKRRKTDTSYEADVLYTKRYIIDKIGEFLPSPTKYLLIDIEIKTKELPSYLNPNNIITCITTYNSASKLIQTWYIGDYGVTFVDGTDCIAENAEDCLLKDFIQYIKSEQPDLLLGWNFVAFDYPYLAARIKKLWNLDFAELISPINKTRYGRKEDEIPYPAGISILDYLDMFKKIYRTEVSYSLDAISQKYLGTPPNEKVNFNSISEEIKTKNIEDVKKMVALEQKQKIIAYYDEIRRMGKCFWEDLTWNSKVLDVMLLSEAKKMGIVLPSKHYGEDIIMDEVEFEGAYRRAELGKFENLHKLDLSSAYPMAIIDFCLDIANLTDNKNEQKIDITDRETHEVKYSIYMKQNSNALLPSIARKLIVKKDYLKKELKALDPESPEAKDLQIKYDAVKALVNSLFGVTALKVFRLYNVNIASAITSIVRDVLHYVEAGLNAKGMKVIYLDTDSLFIEAKENPTELCNQLISQWAKEKYNKDRIGITFDYEGVFEKILVVALCHYVGYLKKKDGKIKKEIKGVEAKRKDSSKFMQQFQTELIEKILNNESQEQIVEFINLEKQRIKTVPITDIGFPAKINSEKDYKSVPIFQRALEYSQDLFRFTKVAGDTFYWLYVESFGEATRKARRTMKNKETGEREERASETTIDKNVLAYDEDTVSNIKNIAWDKMIDKTIIGKCEHIFEALKWDLSLIKKVKITKKQAQTILNLVKESEKVVPFAEDKRINPNDIATCAKSGLTIEPYFKEDAGIIYNSDCGQMFKTLENNSVHMVFTSPPYNTGGTGKNKGMYKTYSDNLTDEQYYNLLSNTISESLRVCKGLIFFNINYMTNNKKVLYRILSDFSEYLRENIIWKKDRIQPPIGNILGKRYEYIFVFSKDSKILVNNFRDNLAKNYTKEFGNWISNLIEVSLKTDQTKYSKINRAGFPLDLPKMFIDIYTKEGDTILDPFMGMGTTALAAKALKRKYIGSELLEHSCEIIKERLIND